MPYEIAFDKAVAIADRWGLFDRVVDAPELEEVRQRVEAALAGWTDTPCRVVRVDAEYHPTREGR